MARARTVPAGALVHAPGDVASEKQANEEDRAAVVKEDVEIAVPGGELLFFRLAPLPAPVGDVGGEDEPAEAEPGR